jgi:folate-binding protein YgfZ
MFEEYRISNGIPAFPFELSTIYNPLEAGLNHLISWTKGCYVGQEVIARLDTYKKVQRKLVRFRLDNHPCALPAAIMSGAEEAGLLTSLSKTRGIGGFAGLGYLKTAHLKTLESLSISQAGQNIRVEPVLE